jgi:outer membrane protein assembly factor BamB
MSKNFGNCRYHCSPGEHDIHGDPLFVDIANGDYHLQNKFDGWPEDSPCIDAGDPSDDFSLEPEPNGDRINQGAYGGTIEAARTKHDEKTGAIQGKVTSAETAQGISGATVSTDKEGYSTTTSADGSYTLSKVDAGTYTVTASAPRYLPKSQSNVEVIAGETTTLNFDLTLEPTPPKTPINLSPKDGAEVDSLTPTLTASAFSDPSKEDTHKASQWQITQKAGDYSSPVFDSGEDTFSLASIQIPPGKLKYSTTYYWRVRYEDNHGAWSEYSKETSFTTYTPPPLIEECALLFQPDPQHIRRSENRGPQKPGLKWTKPFDTFKCPHKYDVGVEGQEWQGQKVYLYALAPDGGEEWKVYIGNTYSIPWQAIRISAIGKDGTIYLDSYGRIIAVTQNGVKWEVYVDWADFPPPTIVAVGFDGTVYTVSGDWVTAVAPNGQIKWISMHGRYTAVASVASDETFYIYGTLYPPGGKEDIGLHALSPKDGSAKWSYKIDGPTPIAIGTDGIIYIGSKTDGKFYAVNPKDGAKIWEYPKDGSIPVSTAPIVDADNTIYFGTEDRKLYALSSDGSLKWKFEVASPIASILAIGDGTIYFETEDRKLYAVGEAPQIPPWDINQDGVVDISDLVIVGKSFGRKVADEEEPLWETVGDNSEPDKADVNDDGEVDISDLVLVGQHFGEKTEPLAAPSHVTSSNSSVD